MESFRCRSGYCWLPRDISTTLYTAGHSRYSANIERVSLNTFQDDGRLRLWKEGIRIIESRPLTGWGTEVSDLLYFQRANLYPNREFELVLPDRSHNIIIDTAISTGLIGTMIFLSCGPTLVVRSGGISIRRATVSRDYSDIAIRSLCDSSFYGI